MTDPLTPAATLLLWRLLGQHGEALQKDLDAAKPEVDPKVRDWLVSHGLIEIDKSKRAYRLKVTEDKGWAWAAEHLADELPEKYGMLRDWLLLLRAHLVRNGETLADFIGPAPERAPIELPVKQKRQGKPKRAQANTAAPETKSAETPPAEIARSPKTPTNGKRRTDPTPKQLRQRLEEAYLAVTGGRFNEAAMLSKVRAELSDVDPKTLDAILLHVLQGRDPKARLGQTTDPKRLTPDDRAAAFAPGGEPYHHLWMTR